MVNTDDFIKRLEIILDYYSLNASSFADKIGVQEDNVSVGNFKQPVSLFKPIDFESEDYLKNQLMNLS